MSVVSYKQENFIGIVTIERPEALNALNSQFRNNKSSFINRFRNKVFCCRSRYCWNVYFK